MSILEFALGMVIVAIVGSLGFYALTIHAIDCGVLNRKRTMHNDMEVHIYKFEDAVNNMAKEQENGNKDN